MEAPHPLVTAGTTSNRGHCTGNVHSDRPTRWTSLRVLQRQIFPGVLFDEARPGLPASVDGQTITFFTVFSTPASTPVEVCGLLCSRTLLACPHRWTLLSRLTRRKTTSVASAGLSRLRQAFVLSTLLSTSLRTGGGERLLLCSRLSLITRTGGPLLFLLRTCFDYYVRLTASAVSISLSRRRQAVVSSSRRRRAIASATTRLSLPPGCSAGGRYSKTSLQRQLRGRRPLFGDQCLSSPERRSILRPQQWR